MKLSNSWHVSVGSGSLILFSLLASPSLKAQPLSPVFASLSDSTVMDMKIARALGDSLFYFSPSEYRPQWHTFLTNIPGDWKQYFSVTFRSENLPAILGVAIMTAGLIATDEDSWQASNRWYKGSQTVSYWSNFFSDFGDGRTQFGLAVAFTLYGVTFDDARALRTGSQVAQVVLASGSVIQVLKHITGRESPFAESRPGGAWQFFPNQIEYHKRVPQYDAFPSGHVCTAVATTVVIAENYPDSKWIRPVGFTLAALVGVGMVNRGIHWYSDYPLGAVIGYSFGMIAAHPELVTFSKSNGQQSTEISLGPYIRESGAGLQMTVQF